MQRWMQDDQISRILMILTCIKGNSSGWPMNRRKPGFVEKTVDSLILGEISFFLKHLKFGMLHRMTSPVKVAVEHNLEAFLFSWPCQPIFLLHRACSTLFWRWQISKTLKYHHLQLLKEAAVDGILIQSQLLVEGTTYTNISHNLSKSKYHTHKPYESDSITGLKRS